MITLQDLTIERSVAEWGGAVARVSVEFPEQWSDDTRTRTFELKSTAGLEGIKRGGHGIHVNEVRSGYSGPGNWRGAFETTDMDKALYLLVDYLNELAERQRADQATTGVLSELNEALADFGESLNDPSRRDFREEWVRARKAFAAVEMALAPFMAED